MYLKYEINTSESWDSKREVLDLIFIAVIIHKQIMVKSEFILMHPSLQK